MNKLKTKSIIIGAVFIATLATGGAVAFFSWQQQGLNNMLSAYSNVKMPNYLVLENKTCNTHFLRPKATSCLFVYSTTESRSKVWDGLMHSMNNANYETKFAWSRSVNPLPPSQFESFGAKLHLKAVLEPTDNRAANYNKVNKVTVDVRKVEQ